jgi:hypothetical protein
LVPYSTIHSDRIAKAAALKITLTRINPPKSGGQAGWSEAEIPFIGEIPNQKYQIPNMLRTLENEHIKIVLVIGACYLRF